MARGRRKPQFTYGANRWAMVVVTAKVHIVARRCDASGQPSLRGDNVSFPTGMRLRVLGQIRHPLMFPPTATALVAYDEEQPERIGLVTEDEVVRVLDAVSEDPPMTEEEFKLFLDREFPDPGTDN